MKGLSPETIRVLCNEYESKRTRNTNATLTADIKYDGTEVVRVDFPDEKDVVAGSLVLHEKPATQPRKLRR